MLRRLFAVLTLIPWLSLQGCVSTRQTASNVIDIDNMDMKSISKMKKGEACISRVLFLFQWGDQLLTTAANQAKINKIKFIENKEEFYLVFGKSCIVVYGEA